MLAAKRKHLLEGFAVGVRASLSTVNEHAHDCQTLLPCIITADHLLLVKVRWLCLLRAAHTQIDDAAVLSVCYGHTEVIVTKPRCVKCSTLAGARRNSMA